MVRKPQQAQHLLASYLPGVISCVPDASLVSACQVPALDFQPHVYFKEQFFSMYGHVTLQVMAAGIPVFFFLGGGICWAHLVFAWRSALKFKVLPPGVKPRSIHRFSTEFDVEIASRIGRIWDEEGVMDSAALDLAENVLKVILSADGAGAYRRL